MKELESAQPLEASVVESTEAPKAPEIEVCEALPTKEEWYAFLTSNRFWAMIIGALAIYGQQKGWLGEAEMQLVATLSGIFIGIRTIDRVSDRLSK